MRRWIVALVLAVFLAVPQTSWADEGASPAAWAEEALPQAAGTDEAVPQAAGADEAPTPDPTGGWSTATYGDGALD